MAPGAPSASKAVLDFDPNEADPLAVEQTRRLLSQVVASRGHEGLRKALHVTEPVAAALKHRVACVTCRSRLEPLVTNLVTSTASSSKSPPEEPEGMNRPLPLTSWLSADESRGLEPAPGARQDVAALAAFLASFGGGSSLEDMGEEQLRRGSGRGNAGVVRCQYHAQYCGCGFRCTCCAPRGPRTKKGALNNFPPALAEAATLAALQPDLLASYEKERFVAILQSGTSEAEWRQLGTVDLDALCELFFWLTDRGLCNTCIDAVVGLQQEIRAAAATTCACGKCPSSEKSKKAKSVALPPPPGKPRIPGIAPEVLRVQGRLKAICGIYRIQPNTLNGRAVYKKDRSEAYLLYTTLRDWMFSGRPDAGGQRCEGWAYVTDSAEFPDEVCSVWKVSGSKGWEEDTSLVVSCYEGLPAEFKEKGSCSFEGSNVVTEKVCYDDGLLCIPVNKPEVLEEVLWANDEPPPVRSKSGCMHILKLEEAQAELQFWLRRLLRDRLDQQRKRILAQGQVGSALCKMYSCAALQQLEEAAEMRAGRKDKKGRAKKRLEAQAAWREEEAKRSADSARCEDAPAASSSASPGCAGSDASASTRASSEEPPDEEMAKVAAGVKRLMTEMGWSREATMPPALEGEEVAEWREQNPTYRQTIQQERQRLRSQFLEWASLTR